MNGLYVYYMVYSRKNLILYSKVKFIFITVEELQQRVIKGHHIDEMIKNFL
jgi:hypothetical protein